ncbi:hypothetical protein [Nostoc sp. NZL]|nr:hypothetical protein [Nostoc sp. NZL]
MLIDVNLSKKPFQISFPASGLEMLLLAALPPGRHSQSETRNETRVNL